MISFVVERAGSNLVGCLTHEIGIPYNTLMKLLREKEVIVNGKRVSQNIDIAVGDKVTVFYTRSDIKVLYIDDNLLVCCKPKGVPSVGKHSYEEQVQQTFPTAIAVHRLDTNTDGIMLFALGDNSRDILDKLFADRQITKSYRATVCGKMPKKHDTIKVYLTKDAEQGIVRVSNERTRGALTAITEYSEILYNSVTDTSDLDITLHTGRTHQIRATMAYIGHPVLGDGKYGDVRRNQSQHKRKQCLTAVSVTFIIPREHPWSYLDGRKISIDV